MTETPKNPPLRYYGGKWRIAPWIISHFPSHLNYIEPCMGSAAVLLRKPRSALETANDIDGNVVTFFRVLRDRPCDLIAAIELTPWARSEHDLARTLNTTTGIDDLERARRFMIRSFMSISGATNETPHTGSFRITKDVRTRKKTAPYDLIDRDLRTVARRLIGVQIECLDYRDAIERYDNDQALIYLDPPYPPNTRSHQSGVYRHEWTNPDHIEAAQLMRQSAGLALVSGSPCALYADLYEAHGWIRRDRQAGANSGARRTESLWISPRTWDTLQNKLVQGVFT